MLPMFFNNSYPYTDFHELNLSWLLNRVKELEIELKNFVGINTIKYADPIQWDITKQYEANTIVIDANTGTAYISTHPVPSGVALTNTDYWTVVFTLDINKSNENITLRNDGNNTNATFESVAGDWVIVSGILYKVNSTIDIGDTYVPNYNIIRYTVELYIKDYISDVLNVIGDLNDLTTTDKDSIVDAINEVVTSLNKIGDLNDLTTTDKDNLVDAINEVVNTLSTTIGDLNDLTTTDKSSVVNAINEVNSTGGGALALIGDMNDLRTVNKDTVVNAINEVFDDVQNITDLKIYNVLDYGATGDGSTDDTQAFNDVIDILNSYGGVMYIPAGDYAINSLTPITHGCQIIGAGSQTRLIIKNNTDYVFKLSGWARGRMSNLSFKDESSNGYLIGLSTGNFTFIDNIWLIDAYRFIELGHADATSVDGYMTTIQNVWGNVVQTFILHHGSRSVTYVNNCSINSEYANSATCISVADKVGLDTFVITNSAFQRFANGFAINQAPGTFFTSNIWIDHVIFDAITSRAIILNITNNFCRLFVSNCWSAHDANYNPNEFVLAQNLGTGIVATLVFNDNEIPYCYNTAFRFVKCYGITINNNEILSYGASTPAMIFDTCTHAKINNNSIGSDGSNVPPSVGDIMVCTACRRFLIACNRMTVASSFAGSGITTFRIASNLNIADAVG